MTKKNRAGTFVGGLLLGSAVGTVVGLLIAPRSGKATRKIVQKSAAAIPELVEDLTTTLQLQSNRLSASTLRNWEATLARLKESLAAGVIASQQEEIDLEANPESSVSVPSATIDRAKHATKEQSIQ
jgi:gas vesicle protein